MQKQKKFVLKEKKIRNKKFVLKNDKRKNKLKNKLNQLKINNKIRKQKQANKKRIPPSTKNQFIQLFITLIMFGASLCALFITNFIFTSKGLSIIDFSSPLSSLNSILVGLIYISIAYTSLLLFCNGALTLYEILSNKDEKSKNLVLLRKIIHNSIFYSVIFFASMGFIIYFISIFIPTKFLVIPNWGFLAFFLIDFCLSFVLVDKLRDGIKKMWKYFSLYEKIWFSTILIASVAIAIAVPQEDVNGVNGGIIMALYLADIILNVLCELLISKQSRWNFIISLAIEIVEVATLLILSAMFASIATIIFFWIPIDIISFVNWTKHKDRNDEEVTAVRTMNWWQNIIFVVSVAAFTLGVGYLLARYSPDSDFFDSDKIKRIVAYLDSCESAIAVANGVFIWLRFREQWGTWLVVTILEAAINIITGQWILLVLKVGYLTNIVYGYIKWTKYIKTHNKNDDIALHRTLATNNNAQYDENVSLHLSDDFIDKTNNELSNENNDTIDGIISPNKGSDASST